MLCSYRRRDMAGLGLHGLTKIREYTEIRFIFHIFPLKGRPIHGLFMSLDCSANSLHHFVRLFIVIYVFLVRTIDTICLDLLNETTKQNKTLGWSGLVMGLVWSLGRTQPTPGTDRTIWPCRAQVGNACAAWANFASEGAI